MVARSASVSAWALAMLATIAIVPPALAQEAAGSKPPVQAIWKYREIPFTFQSFTTFYSCDSLERKIKRILIAVGADRNLRLRTKGCFSTNEIARVPNVQISVFSAVEATPDAIAERNRTRSTRELVARVRGESKELEQFEEAFPAEWRQFELSRGRVYLEPGDCELIDQLVDKVFPQLGVRVLETELSCAPNRVSTAQPRLVVEALMPMPKPDAPATAPDR